MIRYFFVGSISAIVDISLFTLFAKYLNYNYILVGFITFILATYVNYVLSIKYVFSSGLRFKKKLEVLLVFLVSSLAMIVNLLALFFLIEYLMLDPVLSKILASATVFFWNYLTRKKIIFSQLK